MMGTRAGDSDAMEDAGQGKVEEDGDLQQHEN